LLEDAMRARLTRRRRSSSANAFFREIENLEREMTANEEVQAQDERPGIERELSREQRERIARKLVRLAGALLVENRGEER
jgi:hypothetical protein